jgi:hypothetical protein
MSKVVNNKNNNKLPVAKSLGQVEKIYEASNVELNKLEEKKNIEKIINKKSNNSENYNKIDLLNKYKIIIYPIFFLIYFFFYFAAYISNVYNIEKNLKNLTDKKYLLYIVDFILLIIIIGYIVYLNKNINNVIYNNLSTNLKIFAIITFMLFVAIYNNLFFINELESFISLNIVKKIFLIFQVLFILLFGILFLNDFMNSENMYYSTELYIVFFILIILFIFNILSYLNNYKYTINLLENSNLSLLSENCFNDGSTNNENYVNSSSSNNSLYIQNILSKYGSNYLQTIGNIPVNYFNKIAKSYSNLTISDFYYPGSYYTYISQSPYNGIPNLKAIEMALTKFKCRFIHLDIYSDNLNYAAKDANPVIRCPVLKAGAKPLDLLETFKLINKYAWISSSNDDISYPLFLYLNIDTNGSNEIYLKIYKIFMEVFSQYLIDKKYGFCGRNGQSPISNATMTESIGKIILITNTYPTKSILDELINGSTNSLDHFFNINVYKDSYITYNKVGISTDNNKNTMVNNSATNLHFYRTIPLNNSKIVKYQEKDGMFNPSFQDCAQYGIQGTLMYLFIPDDNLNKWFMFFKNTNNMNPVLKDESLRLVKQKKKEIKEQNPILGFQKSQKYCLGPGMETNKSNISGNLTNNSCNV